MISILSVPVGPPISTGGGTIGGNYDFTGNVTISGLLTAVSGAILVDLSTSDKMLTLNTPNSGAGVSGDGFSGIMVDRGSLEDTGIVWDEATDGWIVKYESSASQTLCVRSTAPTSGAIPFGNNVNGYTHSSNLHFDTNNNRLGVGTNNPTVSLDVRKAGAVQSNLTDSTNNITLASIAGTADASIGTTTTHDLRLVTDNTDRGVITKEGYYGIGTITPGSSATTGLAALSLQPALHIHSPATLYTAKTGNTLYEYLIDKAASANQKTMKTDYHSQVLHYSSINDDNSAKKTDILCIDGVNGRVGVGISNPTTQLYVKDTTGDCELDIEGNTTVLRLGALATRGYVGTNNSIPLQLGAGGSTCAVLTSTLFGIGSGFTPSQKLHIQSNTAPNMYVTMNPSGTAVTARVGSDASMTYFGSQTNQPTNIVTNDTTRIYVTETGVIGLNTTTPGVSAQSGLTSTIANTTFASHATGGNINVFTGQAVTEFLSDNNSAVNSKCIKRENSNGTYTISTLNDNQTTKFNAITVDMVNSRVGIGNAAPVSALDVTGTATFQNTVVLSGGQLQFPPVQVASADVNCFDDYKEGTFTPSLSLTSQDGSFTFTEQAGAYTKAGNMVHFDIALTWTAIPSGGTSLRVTGLPYTCNATYSGFTTVCKSSGISGTWATNSPHVGEIEPSTTTIYMLNNNTTNSRDFDWNEIPSANRLQFSGSYRV